MPTAAPPATEAKKPAPPAPAKAAAPAPAKAGPAAPALAGPQSAATQRFDRMAVRAKLAVSGPGDAAEQEADRVAEHVMRSPDPARPAPPRVQRQPQPDAGTAPTLSPAAEQRVQASRGGGMPLPPDTRADMESQLGHDFSGVRIHDDGEAAALCTETAAHAFTVGNDIYFGPGEFDPAGREGRALLAHELAHVMQSGGSTATGAHRLQRKAKADGGAGTYNRGSGVVEFDAIAIPSNYAAAYQAKAPLIRHRAFSEDSRPASQQQTWQDHINTGQAVPKLGSVVAAHPNAASAAPATFVFKTPSPMQQINGASPRFVMGSSLEACAQQLSVPSWDRQGHKVGTARATRLTSYDVDHVVEAQVAASSESGRQFVMRPELDSIANFQLLTGTANTAKMNAVKGAVRDKVNTFREQNAEVYRNKPFSDWATEALLGHLSVKFLTVTEAAALETPVNARWTREEIEQGTHLQALIDAQQIQFLTVADMNVPANHAWIFQGPAGGFKNDVDKRARSWWRTLLSPFEITNANFNTGEPAVLARLSVNVPASQTRLKRFDADKTVDVKSLDGSDSVGHFEMQRWRQIMELRRPAGEPGGAPSAPSPGLEARPLSPLTLDTVDVVPGVGLVIEGQILPTLPVIGAANIRYRIAGSDLSLMKTFTVSEINLPPPISIDSCSLTLSAGTRGFSADGRIDLSIERLGTGFLAGSMGTAGGLELEGGFDFDRTLFDRATLRAWYREEQFGAAGELAIEHPDKVRGIRAALLNVNYTAGVLTASGTVTPDLPGVEEGNLRLTHSEAEGLMIGGALRLAANPAIRSGTLDVTARRRDDAWRVAASGRAQPALPGITSELTVAYDDGAFDASFRGAFSRGMLSGTVEAGATNRTLDDAGNPTGAAAPGAPITVYGSGSATMQIAPWLQGTAGIRFAPSGEVTVVGEIGLPSSMELFGRQEIHRTLFSLATQIPIVPGIVAEVGGNLNATAGIGPGVLDQARIGVQYNPSREEDTRVTGDAHLNIPADAGLRLGARAGIGLGITGASATGGVEIGGALGIAGAAEASVHVEWTPTQGVQIDAEGALHASPRFRFDVSGYVSVRALGFEVYDHTWELAALELGSDMALGVRFPVRYREGEPFNVSTDDLVFEVPDIDTAALLGQLGRQIF